MKTPCSEDRGPLFGGKLLANRYELLERLGSGGMGVVYAASDLLRSEEVALKVLRQPLCADETEYRRFAQEATIASRLFHPNIVEVKDFQTEGEGAPYLIMERVRGTDLHRLLEARGVLVWPLAVDILRQIGSALHAAHTVGIIHRDIKPGNILLTPVDPEPDAGGERFVVKVADFGISKILGSSHPGYTVHGQIMGTPEYLSPEATTGEPLDSRADQWSLGIVAYQMLTGRVPFRHRDELTTMLKVRTQALRPLRCLASDVPRHITEAVEIALSKRREDRFVTVQDFVRALSGLPPLHGSARPAPQRASSYGEAVPLPVSQSNPLPVYVDPDSGPRHARESARTRSMAPAPSCQRDRASVPDCIPDWTDQVDLVSERVVVSPPSCNGNHVAAAPSVLRSAPCLTGERHSPMNDRSKPPLRLVESGASLVRRGLRAATWLAAGLLTVGAVQGICHLLLQPQQLYASEREPPRPTPAAALAASPGPSGGPSVDPSPQGGALAALGATAAADPAPEGDPSDPDAALDCRPLGRRPAPIPPDSGPRGARSTTAASPSPWPTRRRVPLLQLPNKEPAGCATSEAPLGSPSAAEPERSPSPSARSQPVDPAPSLASEPPAPALDEPAPDGVRRSEASPGELQRRFASLERQSGEDPHVPPSLRALYRGQTLEGRYLICVLADGSVHSVTVKKAAADTDAGIVAALKSWRYPPQPAGTLTCTAELLQFEL